MKIFELGDKLRRKKSPNGVGRTYGPNTPKRISNHFIEYL